MRVCPVSEPEPSVGVRFGLELPLDTDISVRPMTRAVSYTNWLRNECRVLILKRIDTRWVVDTTQSFPLDTEQPSPLPELKITGELLADAFAFELRPGDYRVVAVLNAGLTTWNDALVPGTVVADDNDASLRTPPLVTYSFSTHFMNDGYRMLGREVFVAVKDFTVPKSSDLHASGMGPITLRAERRVGKFRILLKDKKASNGLNFENTQHKFQGIFTSRTKAFPEGIDALGGMYRSEAGLYELPWCMCMYGGYHYSGTEAYQSTQTNATIFSPFLFADPAEELTFEISEIFISGQSQSFSYRTDEVFTRRLGASKICGIVFETTPTIDVPNLLVDIVESTDPTTGEKEDAVKLFDPFFEWNAQYDTNIKER